MKSIRALFITFTLLVLVLPLGPSAIAATSPIEIQTQCVFDDHVCLTIAYTNTCDGWHSAPGQYLISRLPYSAATPTYDGPISGTWTQSGELESITITVSTEVFLNDVSFQSLGMQDFVFEIVEPAECAPAACALKEKYFMYTLRDSNQPDSWLPYCYIISNNGFPSTERQAQLCSVPGYDHTFKATQLVYSGWVSTGCGEPSYGWPAWKHDWYRPEFASQ